MNQPVRNGAIPANDLEAEAAVLSALIHEPSRLVEVRAELAPKSFYANANQVVFETLSFLADSGAKVDAVTLASALRDRGRLDQIGGTAYIAQLSDATPAVANVLEHAKIVAHKYRDRELHQLGQELAAGVTSAEAAQQRLRALSAKVEAARWQELDTNAIFGALEPVNYLLAPLDICAGAPTLIAGYGFSGKTVAMQSMALSLAAGRDVWGVFKASPARVLHCDWEQGPRLTREKYQRLAAAQVLAPTDLESRLVLVSMPQVYLDSEYAETFMLERCAGFDLVIIDSLRAACPTLDENDAAARNVIDRLTRVSVRTGATIAMIHHARKPQRDAAGGAKMAIRGSGAIFDACASVLVFEAEKGQPTRVMHEKARNSGRPADDFLLRVEDVEVDGNPRGGLIVTAEATSSKEAGADEQKRARLEKLCERIIALFEQKGEQKSKDAIRGEVGAAKDDVSAAVDMLISRGRLRVEGKTTNRRLVLVSPK